MKKGICRHLKRIYIDGENTDCRCMKQGCKVEKKDCKECKQWVGAADYHPRDLQEPKPRRRERPPEPCREAPKVCVVSIQNACRLA